VRVVVSYSKPEKARKYKDTLKGIEGGGFEIVDADSNAPASTANWRELQRRADGLLLTGGPDVEPTRYGETVDPAAGVESIPERDAMEWELLRVARDERQPVLAICRGHQLANAFLGGKLWQDLGALGAEVRHRHDPDETNRRLLAHDLEVDPVASPLGELFERCAPIRVNSLHHQAVRVAGEGMRIVARSPDGVVEATDFAGRDWWLWSVQWHPEELVGAEDHPLHRALFERFLLETRRFAARRLGAEVAR
jgi:putative glutamine amidotransferase